EYRRTRRKCEIQIRSIAELRSGNAHGAGRYRAPAADPATPMEVDSVPTRRLKSHRRIPLRSEEQMTMIGCDYGLSDTCGCETLQAPRKILNNAIHDAS